jgi:Fe(3+) dicitrate transport protein
LQEWRGFWPAAESGVLRKDVVRDEWYLSPFLENLFRVWRFSITPGVRIENLWQRVNEKFNASKTTVALTDDKSFSVVPLFGLGIVFEVAKGIEVYTNISQSYRPVTYTAAVPLGTNQVSNGNLDEGHGIQYDFGFRGHPMPFITWDIDYFHFRFKDQIGTVGNTIDNIGHTSNNGMELFTELDVVGAWDYAAKTTFADTIGNLAPFVTLTAMDAQIYAGPGNLLGRRVAYAPQYNFRFGINYRWRDRVKVSLLSTFVDNQFGDDLNSTERQIPSYKVWDLTAELKVLKELLGVLDVSLLGGVNNMFDEEYYSRVTGTGIDPGYPRNIYGGFKVTLTNPFEKRLVESSAAQKGY